MLAVLAGGLVTDEDLTVLALVSVAVCHERTLPQPPNSSSYFLQKMKN
jgi:hypothetical protein